MRLKAFYLVSTSMAGLNTFSVNIVISDASFIPGNIGPSLKLIFRTYHQVRPKLSCEVGAAGPELKLLFLPLPMQIDIFLPVTYCSLRMEFTCLVNYFLVIGFSLIFLHDFHDRKLLKIH